MQTFLPYYSFNKCAKCLDNKRLGKQRVECKQILSALQTGKGWIYHPATKMWSGNENSLKYYMNCMIVEWVNRGFKNNIQLNEVNKNIQKPEWLDDKLIYSHRANLMKKMPSHYNWENIDINAPYWWPTGLKDNKKNKQMNEYYERWL